MWQEKLQIKKTNPIHGLYPFSKMWIVFLFCTTTIVLSSVRTNGYPIHMMLSFLIIPILAIATGIFRKISGVLKSIGFIAILIIVLQGLLIKSNEILYSLNVFGLFNINLYTDNFQHGLVLAFSVLNMGGIVAWFFGATDNKELVRALEKKGMSPKTSYVLLSTLQMIGVLQKSSKVIMSAQQARGVETEGNIFVRSKAFIPTMVPLIIGSITNTEERVLTLESKGFLVKGNKTRLFDVKPNGKEPAALTIAVLYTLGIIVWRIILWVM